MRSLITTLLCLFSITSYSGVIVVDKDLPYTSLGKSVTYYKDAKANFSLAQVMQADIKGEFLSSDADILNFGSSNSAYWIKASYLTKSGDKAFLILDISSIEDIDVYTEDGKGGFIRTHAGSLAPVNPNVITSSNYIFNLPKNTDVTKPQDVYLRVKTHNILLVPLKMAVSENLLAGVSAMQRLETIYIGILIALFFFNVSVFITSKDKTYFFYSMYLISLFIYVVFYFRGYSYLFGEDVRYFINAYPSVFLSIGAMSGIAFACTFLNLQVVLPRAKYIVKFLMAGWLVVVIISLTGNKSVSSFISQIFSVITMLTVWTLGIMAYSRGYKPALYFIIARASVCLITLWLVLSLVNIFPYNELTFQIAPLGFIFELLLISLAMGDRLKEMKRVSLAEQSDKLKIQEENLYLISSQNERLEKVVESRTKALKKMVQSLETANADKNRLFSIIAHDLRSPFNSLISLFSLNDMDMLTFEDVKMLLNDSRKNIDNIHNTLNNLLYWAQSQMQGITTAPSRFNVRVLVEDLMLVYQPLINKKNIKTNFIVDDDSDVIADLNQINLVMRNLLDNAIKFTPFDRFIHIRIWGNSSHIYVDVCNPVAGALNVDKLADKEGSQPSYGTSNERGVGLGLHLCRDFIQKNKGQLKVSKEEECIVLRFNLPKFSVHQSETFQAAEEAEV